MNDASAPIRHILVPHDFSETAEKALGLALELAGKLGATVTVLHAYEVPTYGFAEGVAMTPALGGEVERAAQAGLDEVAGRARRSGLEVHAILRQGPVCNEIDLAAKEHDIGLIVMGTHGRQGIARMLLGSTAEKVVRTAPCPVLTVHGPEGAAAE
jgi:nucleotide-binding universal stress UspA family protein